MRFKKHNKLIFLYSIFITKNDCKYNKLITPISSMVLGGLIGI